MELGSLVYVCLLLFFLICFVFERKRAHLSSVASDLVNQMSRIQNSYILFAFWIRINLYALFFVTQIEVQERQVTIISGYFIFLIFFEDWNPYLQSWWVFLFVFLFCFSYNSEHKMPWYLLKQRWILWVLSLT